MTDLQPVDVIQAALDGHDSVAISFSGAEDVVLIDMVCNIIDRPQVFCLDTGRLHPETYAFIEQVRDHYGIAIQVLNPDASALGRLVQEKGLFSFYKDGHQECCSVRKIAPLRRYLSGCDAWITGQRRDQSPTRSQVPQSQIDAAFSVDRSPADRPPLMKYNPLANWTSGQVWQYIRDHQVPYNPLHDRGFLSIGCQPCTRAVGPGQHERAGRWWWEEATLKECGLHSANVKQP